MCKNFLTLFIFLFCGIIFIGCQSDKVKEATENQKIAEIQKMDMGQLQKMESTTNIYKSFDSLIFYSILGMGISVILFTYSSKIAIPALLGNLAILFLSLILSQFLRIFAIISILSIFVMVILIIYLSIKDNNLINYLKSKISTDP